MPSLRRFVLATAAAAAASVLAATSAAAQGSVRYAGEDRYDTAAFLSTQLSQRKSPTPVFLVTGTDYPDAVSASAMASRLGGRVLLTERDRLPQTTADELAHLARWDRVERVVVVGGAGAISDGVLDQVKAVAHDHLGAVPVERVSGSDRYDTSRLLATRFAGTPLAAANPVRAVFFATGTNYPDALSGAAVAGRTNAPVLLVQPGAVPAATLTALRSGELAAVTTYYVMGSAGAVGDAVIAQLTANNPRAVVERIGGADRYETSVKAADRFFPGTPKVALVTGDNFPDALSASVLTDDRDMPLFLTRGNTVPRSVDASMRERGVYDVNGWLMLIGAVDFSFRVADA